jgi:hypothetical protein
MLGIVAYIPAVMAWLNLHLGEEAGHLGGTISFVAGWALIGASCSFSAGSRYQKSS